jgi:hypothetical protein
LKTIPAPPSTSTSSPRNVLPAANVRLPLPMSMLPPVQLPYFFGPPPMMVTLL